MRVTIRILDAGIRANSFGSPQYSDALVEWILEKFDTDLDFFTRIRKMYSEIRPPRQWRTRLRRQYVFDAPGRPTYSCAQPQS